ncbi:MAG: hypothetical protein R3B82_05925 [Sandaracinaceae bacterium]
MRRRWIWVFSFLLGCGGSPDPGADAGTTIDAATASDAGATDAGAADAGTTTDAGTDAGAADGGSATVCPAPAPEAGEVVVLDDAAAAGWSFVGAAPGAALQTATVCSGTSALQYAARNPSGEFLQLVDDGSTIDASRLQLRVHVDVDSMWSAAVYQNPIDPTFPTDWEGTLHMGWNVVEVEIPATTTVVNRIALFKLDAGAVTVTVDDVRLLPR